MCRKNSLAFVLVAVSFMLLLSSCAIRPSTYLFPIVGQQSHINKIVVSEVKENYPADKAGIDTDDVLLSLDDQEFDDAEMLMKYLIKTQKTAVFKLLRSNQEIVVEAQPNLQPPKFGIEFNYYDLAGKQVFPLYKDEIVPDQRQQDRFTTRVDSVWQKGKRSSVGCGAALFERTLFLLVRINNLSKQNLELTAEKDIYVTDQNKSLLQMISRDQAESLKKHTVIESVSNNVKHTIPSETKKTINLYFDSKGTTPPYIVNLEVGGEHYEFTFGAKS